MDDTILWTARALAYLALLPAAGLPLYWLTAGRVEAVSPAGRTSAAVLALIAWPASLFWLIASVAAMSGAGLGELDRDTILLVARATPLAGVVEVRLAALALLAAGILLPRVPLALPALAGLVALGTAAFTGHAGAGEGTAGMVQRLVDTAHLAAAACWIAALLRFVAGAPAPEAAADAARRLARFAATGTAVVAILVVTGLANTALIAGWAVPPRSAWTALLALKLALFAAMLCLAALNRWRLVPALDRDEPGAAARLRRSLRAELACAVGLVGVVAVLGTLDPAGG